MLLDVGLEQGIEQGVIGQGIAIALVWTQFGARRLQADRFSDQFARFGQAQVVAAGPGGVAIEPGAELKHGGFVEIADHGQAAVHVAVEGAIAHGQLRFVAGGEQQLAALVGQGHQQGAADARLQIFGRQAGRSSAQGRGEGVVKGAHQLRDCHGLLAEAQPGRQGFGVVDGAAGAVRGGHQQGLQGAGTQGGAGDDGHEGRIDAAAEAQQGPSEAALAGVVGHPQHQGPKQLLLGAWQDRRGSKGRLGGCRRKASIPVGQGRLGAGQLLADRPAGVHHKAGAIEYQLVIAAHLVHINHRAAQAPGGGAGQLLAQDCLALAKGRGREVKK